MLNGNQRVSRSQPLSAALSRSQPLSAAPSRSQPLPAAPSRTFRRAIGGRISAANTENGNGQTRLPCWMNCQPQCVKTIRKSASVFQALTSRRRELKKQKHGQAVGCLVWQEATVCRTFYHRAKSSMWPDAAGRPRFKKSRYLLEMQGVKTVTIVISHACDKFDHGAGHTDPFDPVLEP